MSGGDHRWFKRSTGKERPVTRDIHMYNNNNNNNNNNNKIIIISKKYVSNIPGKHEVKELQKTAILGIAHIIWKVLI